LIRPEKLGGLLESESETTLKRFQLEAQSTAAMRSPHTIQLFDFGVTDEGAFYYVMELLEGFDLHSLVETFGPVAPERAIHFLRQACHSLGEAHATGLVHRDIKPANLYACRYGREVDFIKVLDFGLVKSRRQAADATQLTMADVVSGTPGFMAPEQVLGDRAVDPRSDIYALGCLGFWLVTGQQVFDGNSAMQVMIHHAKTEPNPPSSRSELEIPASYDAAILRCLAKDPDERFQDADELAAALVACQTERDWNAERARIWWDLRAEAGARAVT